MSYEEHKKQTPTSLNCAIVTISNSRNIDTDESGRLIKNLLENNFHKIINYSIIKDNKELINEKINQLIKNNEVNAIITNGGTGLSSKDVTIEAIRPLFDKELTGFNSLFMKLSYEQIGSAAMLSRAIAGIANGKIIFCIPGNPNACKLGVEKLILPEIGHILKHIRE